MNLPEVKLEDLLESGVHFGHNVRRWNPKMKEYMELGQYSYIWFKSYTKLIKYSSYKNPRKLYQNQKILFVGTKKQCSDVVKELALINNNYYVNKRWLGGTLTNWKTISNSIRRLEEIEIFLKDNELSKNLSKKNY